LMLLKTMLQEQERRTYIVHAWIVEILLYLMTFNKSLLIWSVEDL